MNAFGSKIGIKDFEIDRENQIRLLIDLYLHLLCEREFEKSKRVIDLLKRFYS
jgi:hypothetical protein